MAGPWWPSGFWQLVIAAAIYVTRLAYLAMVLEATGKWILLIPAAGSAIAVVWFALASSSGARDRRRTP
jgi:hypothetical protein